MIMRMIQALERFAAKYRLLLSAVLALALSGALALYNISSGPLRNLNDIGGWSNRALFIAMTAAVQALLLLSCALLSRVRFARVALRQVIVTAGFYIMLLAINQKAYAYINLIQPVVRAMDAGGLAAGAAMQHNLSAPALMMTYLVTRGPVYDMYLLKLVSIGCYLLTALLITRAAERNGLGLRAETLLALCVILPQGFMNAACSALAEVWAVALLGVSLTLLFGMDKPRPLAGALFYGAACAISGVCLYALPVYVLAALRGRMKKVHLAVSGAVMLALCVPAMLAGMPDAIGSLFGVNLGAPLYASGAPALINILPRAAVEEIPQYAPILRHLPALDLETYAQPFYTQAHFTVAARGLTLAALAAYAGLCVLIDRRKDGALHSALALVLAALLACPGATSGAWLAADLVCLYAILAAPKLRLPACMVLFATAAGSCYPMTEETLLPMIYAFVLVLLALCMLLDIIPMGREEDAYE